MSLFHKLLEAFLAESFHGPLVALRNGLCLLGATMQADGPFGYKEIQSR